MSRARERERESSESRADEYDSSGSGICGRVGFVDKGTGEHQSNQVFSDKGCSRTIQATDWKDPQLVKCGGGVLTERNRKASVK